MIDRFKALQVVVEEGSVNRAAARLRLAQPALSRQIAALEAELGERLFERTTTGVKPTGFGHEVLRHMRPVTAAYDAALAALRRQARQGRAELRVGFLVSAGPFFLSPALRLLRKSHPQLRLSLHDLSPQEQIDALRGGTLDVALIGQEGVAAAKDFYRRSLGSIGVCVALAASDPLARARRLSLAALREKRFVGVDEAHAPGRNRWMEALCRKAGFKPRWAGTRDGVHNVLSLVVAENAATLLPDYFRRTNHPGVVFRAITDPAARWEFIVLLQRGRPSPEALALVGALEKAAPRVNSGNKRTVKS